MNVDADSFHNVNSKQITDLNVKCKTLKLLEDYNRGENLDNFWYGDFFLTFKTKDKSMKEITDWPNFIKIKSFCSERENVKRM